VQALAAELLKSNFEFAFVPFRGTVSYFRKKICWIVENSQLYKLMHGVFLLTKWFLAVLWYRDSLYIKTIGKSLGKRNEKALFAYLHNIYISTFKEFRDKSIDNEI